MNDDLINDKFLSLQISEFKYLIEILNDFNKSNYHLYLLSTFKKIDSLFDCIKCIDNDCKILKETNLFETLNKLLNIIIDNNEDKNSDQFLNEIIIFLYKYNLDFELNSIENEFDNQLFTDNTILKTLINLLKKQNINNDKFKIDKLLILIKSSLDYSIDYNLLSAADYKNLFDDLIFKLKQLNLFKKQSQNILSIILCCLAILLKIKENDNYINSINFNEFIEYLKDNVDYVNCSNMQKLLSCLYFFIINYPECYDLFLKYDGLQFLDTIQLDKITAKIRSFTYSKNCSKEEEIQKQETDKSTVKEIIYKDEIINNKKIETQKRHPNQLIEPAHEIVGNWNKLATNFDEINLKKELLNCVFNYGFKALSSIQERALIPCIEGNDVIISSSCLSGKKTTAIIAMLQIIDNKLNECQAIILTPNQDKANQIIEFIFNFGKYLKIGCYSCCNSISKDIEKSINKQIVAGTAGRILDLLNRGILKKDNIKLMVLAETDKILSKDLVFNIHEKLNQDDLQIILLATKISTTITEIESKIMRNPFLIAIKSDKLSFKGIKHFYVNFEKSEWKFETLCDIYGALFSKKIQIIILCNSKKNVDLLSERMEKENIDVSYVHGDMNLDLRKKMIKKFKTGLNSVLIVSNLYVNDINTLKVSLIINYDMPENFRENYIDSVSRGLFKDKGVIINFVTSTQIDIQRFNKIKNYYKLKIEEMPLNYEDYF